jgi:hypothetical protein
MEMDPTLLSGAAFISLELCVTCKLFLPPLTSLPLQVLRLVCCDTSRNGRGNHRQWRHFLALFLCLLPRWLPHRHIPPRHQISAVHHLGLESLLLPARLPHAA